MLTTNDTRLDNQPADAGRRAAVLATPPLAQQLRATPPAGNPGSAWLDLQRHRAYTKVTAADATEAGAPTDTATSADRAITAHLVPTGPGWTGTANDLTIYIHLTRSRSGSGWSINDYSVQ